MSTPVRRFGTVTITAGQSLSDAYDIGINETLVGIIVPTWTSAVLTLAAAFPGTNAPQYPYGGPNGATEFRDGLTFGAVMDEGADAEFSVTTGVGNLYVAIDGTKLAGLQYIKVRSGTGAAPVVQAGGATIGIVTATI